MKIGVLPGTFNPPTSAHLALAEAAMAHVDRVVFVLPRVLPHKDYEGVPFEERLALVKHVAEPRFGVASSSAASAARRAAAAACSGSGCSSPAATSAS